MTGPNWRGSSRCRDRECIASRGRLALLETMLMGWALQQVAAAGFTPITVPSLAKYSAFVGTGHFPGHEDEAYAVPADDLFLAGTGEIALTSLHSGEILDGASLPIAYAGLSPCFRREAGSAGRDVRGLLRAFACSSTSTKLVRTSSIGSATFTT